MPQAHFRRGKGKDSTSGSVLNIVLPEQSEVSDIIFACFGWVKGSGGAATRTLAVTDSLSNTYIPMTVRTKTGTGVNNLRMQAYYAINGTQGTPTVTGTLTGGAVDLYGGNIQLLYGIDLNTPLIAESFGQTGSSGATPLSGGTLTTDADGAIIVTMIMHSADRADIVPTGFFLSTDTTSEDGSKYAGAYKEAGAAGAYATLWSWTGGTTNSMAYSAAFRATIPPMGSIFKATPALRTRGLNHGIN